MRCGRRRRRKDGGGAAASVSWPDWPAGSGSRSFNFENASQCASDALPGGLRALPGHAFWGDTISVADAAVIDPVRVSSHSQVTDSYLLALI